MMEYAILILSGLSFLMLLVLLILKLKKKTVGKTDDDTTEVLAEAVSILREEIKKECGAVKENTTTQLRLYSETLDRSQTAAERRFEDFAQTNAYRLDKMREDIAKSIYDLNEANAKQIDKMRETVDEKLTATLDQRFKQSFAIVTESLDTITKNFGEMKSLTSDVTDLRKVLTNVKTRGTWGEVSLDNILSQLLTPDQYQKGFKIDKREDGLIVDFAISLPGKDTEKVYLPIDSKFPVEDYQRLIDATNIAEQEAARKALANTIKTQAISIKNKYVRPPKTTDFAIMFLPSEGIFAEALQIRGLAEEVQTKHRVVLCGPTTISALLNSLQMGFKTVAIERRSSEIWKLLGQFKRDFGTFNELLGKTQRQIDTIGRTITDANKRTEIIQRRLNRVETDNEDLIEDTSFDLGYLTEGDKGGDEN